MLWKSLYLINNPNTKHFMKKFYKFAKTLNYNFSKSTNPEQFSSMDWKKTKILSSLVLIRLEGEPRLYLDAKKKNQQPIGAAVSCSKP